jgi:hypothetical protein
VPQRGITPQTTRNMPKAARLRFLGSRRSDRIASASSHCFLGIEGIAMAKSSWRKTAILVFFSLCKRRFLWDTRRREV